MTNYEKFNFNKQGKLCLFSGLYNKCNVKTNEKEIVEREKQNPPHPPKSQVVLGNYEMNQ